MKCPLKISPTVMVAAGSFLGVCGAYIIYTLELTAVETSPARAFGMLMLGTLLASLGYSQHLLRERRQEPQADQCGETPDSAPLSGET